MNADNLRKLALEIEQTDPIGAKAVIGFDGFIDEVVHVVSERTDIDHFDRVQTLDEYGKKISAAAGMSLNMEMVPISKKMGGNGPIMADALIRQGTKVTYLGALGKEKIHSIFEPLMKQADVYSFCDPAHTDAIEFFDGKIISCKLEALKEANWNNLKNVISPEKLAGIYDQADVIVFANWTLLMYAGEIWKGIFEEVLPLMKEQKMLFVDLADPHRRKKEDIRDALSLLSKYQQRFDVYLGLNKKEALQIAELIKAEDAEEIGDLAEQLRIKLGFTAVIVHALKDSACSEQHEHAHADGPYCEKPVLTTGAGDNFNAGFVSGRLLGRSLKESLILGNACSGFYVRYGRSCTIPELIAFLREWADGKL